MCTYFKRGDHMNFLNEKIALITGSTSGIGLGIARKIATHDASIILHGIEEEEAVQHIIADIKNITKGHVVYISSDLSTYEGCESLIIKALNHFNHIDILINNAGIQYVSSVEDFPIDQWDRILTINLSSAFYCTKNVLPIMKKNKWGRIINIASAHGLVASVHKSAYVAAKHGLLGFTKVLALETAQQNITCNAICPGWVYTPLVEKQIKDRAIAKNISFDDEKINLLSEKQPSLQFVKPEEIGDLVLFLCSQSASQITGSEIKIDGGWTAQ
jgi:3-hydroxybutyrate dehydrogenase